MLILKKFIFKSKMITSGNKDHYAMREGRLHEEDKTIENIYVPMYITQICKALTNLREKRDINKIIVEVFNSSSSTIARLFT